MRYVITIEANGAWRVLVTVRPWTPDADVDARVADLPRVEHAADVFLTDQWPAPPSILNMLRAFFTGRPVLAIPGRREPMLGTFACDVDDDGNFLIGSRVTA